MTVLRYKDYQGAVTYEDGRLIIQILHIDDFITTECDSASAAQSAFEELIDDYLETCAEIKKEPCKPYKGSFNVRIPPALHKRAAMAAVERGESLNAFVAHALQSSLDHEESGTNFPDVNVLQHVATLILNQTDFSSRAQPWEPLSSGSFAIKTELLNVFERSFTTFDVELGAPRITGSPWSVVQREPWIQTVI